MLEKPVFIPWEKAAALTSPGCSKVGSGKRAQWSYFPSVGLSSWALPDTGFEEAA